MSLKFITIVTGIQLMVLDLNHIFKRYNVWSAHPDAFWSVLTFVFPGEVLQDQHHVEAGHTGYCDHCWRDTKQEDTPWPQSMYPVTPPVLTTMQPTHCAGGRYLRGKQIKKQRLPISPCQKFFLYDNPSVIWWVMTRIHTIYKIVCI